MHARSVFSAWSVAFGVLFSGASVSAEAQGLSTSIGYHYSSGKFGGTQSTNISEIVRSLQSSVLIDGQDIATVTIDSLNLGIADVPQDPALFHRSLRENIAYAKPEASEACLWEAAKAAHCEAFINNRPEGFDVIVGECGVRLSGGERQRVGLGRALLAQPRLLVLDEPLASVDVARRGEVLPYLERLRDRYQIPMIYISHDYEEVLQLAAWLVVMHQGRVLAADTPSALSLSPSLQQRIRADAVGAVIESVVAGRDEANDLMALYVGLELQSLALYVVAAFQRDTVRSTEAGLKYFVLGAVASGMLLFGSSLIYGFCGGTAFVQISRALLDGKAAEIGTVIGLVFVIAGLAFKVSAVPFHSMACVALSTNR